MDPTSINNQLVENSKVYNGHPSKQKDTWAANVWRPRPGDQKSDTQAPPQRKSQRATPPSSLPPPSHIHDASKQTMKTGSPANSSLFAVGVSIWETTPRQTFRPSAPALIDISWQVFAELLTDQSQTSKQLLPEYLDYYATGLLQLRIVHLKQKNSQCLSVEEEQLLTLTQTTAFCVPEPIALQLTHLGNTSNGTKQILIPEFPLLPTTVSGGFRGYHPLPVVPALGVDNTLHLNWIKFPCLGVLSEAVRNAVSTAAPVPYVPSPTYQQAPISQNVPGFWPLGFRRDEAKNLMFLIAWSVLWLSVANGKIKLTLILIWDLKS